MKSVSPQERQNEIYRKMSPKRKAEITFDFMRIGKYLMNLRYQKLTSTNKDVTFCHGVKSEAFDGKNI